MDFFGCSVQMLATLLAPNSLQGEASLRIKRNRNAVLVKPLDSPDVVHKSNHHRAQVKGEETQEAEEHGLDINRL